MRLHLEQEGTLLVAKAEGDLNAESAEAFTEALDDCVAGAGAAVAIDLSAVPSIDSSGLGALIRLVTRARLSQGWVVLVSPSPLVSGGFSATRLDAWFDICTNVDEARTRFARG